MLIKTATEKYFNDIAAIYRLGNGSIKLSRIPNGKWGFHLKNV
jgi:hypothetical protein